MDDADLLAVTEAALADVAPGGMVGPVVMAVELYDENGQPELHIIRSDHTDWTHLGMIQALQYESSAWLQAIYRRDDGIEDDEF